jgi:integrase
LGSVESGHDPIAQRQAARAVPAFRDVAEEFIRTHVAAKRKPRTLTSYKSLLDAHILPAIGTMRVTDIRRHDVSKLHRALSSSPGAANRAISLISAIWNWMATEHDELELPANPAKGIKRNPEEGRERFLTTDELARLGEALAEAETIGLPFSVDETKPTAKHAPKPVNRRRKLDPFAIAAVRLLILTGARFREILHAKWDYVDFERGLLNLPTSKTGRKSIFVSAGALEVLSSLPRIDGNPHIVPGETEGAPRADLKKPWAAIIAAAKLEGLRIHDLRHSFASVPGASLGLPIIGKLLGHSQPATTARYAHLDADPMRRAVETIGNTISAAMNRKPTAEIVPINKRSGSVD